MSMKKTDLDKMKGKKLAGGGIPGSHDRFGRGSAAHGKLGKGARPAGVPLALKLLGSKGTEKK